MKLHMIVAVAENGVIGKDNALPWKLPGDMKFFREKTTGHSVIMGRNTCVSLGRPLKDRRNIVVTRNPQMLPEGFIGATSLESALDLCRGEETVFLIGGATLYREAMDKGMVDVIWLTRVHNAFEGDTFLDLNLNDGWKETWREAHEADERNAWGYGFFRFDRVGG